MTHYPHDFQIFCKLRQFDSTDEKSIIIRHNKKKLLAYYNLSKGFNNALLYVVITKSKKKTKFIHTDKTASLIILSTLDKS